jgi:ferredoxin
MWKKKIAEASDATSESRRGFLKAVLPSVCAVIPAFNVLKAEQTESGYNESRKHPVTPPGSLAIEHFTANCTACQLCVSSCPTKVLQPTFFEYGIAGILQPKMDFNVSYCNYDCVICTEICPSGAILPLRLEEKKLTQLGKAKFFRDDCIVVTKKKDCAACSEHCPTKAVNMILTEGLMLPEVKDSICIGCGACEHACPTIPRKAIYVESNVVHLRAEKPQIKKVKQEKAVPEEFPF